MFSAGQMRPCREAYYQPSDSLKIKTASVEPQPDVIKVLSVVDMFCYFELFCNFVFGEFVYYILQYVPDTLIFLVVLIMMT